MPRSETLFEDEIRKLLHDIEFDNVPRWGSNREVFRIGRYEIDAFGRWDDLYVVVDVKTSTSQRAMRRGIENQLTTINGYRNAVTQGIIREYRGRYGYRDSIFIFWTKDKVVEEQHLELARRYGIAIRDYFDLSCYRKSLEITRSPRIVRNGFLTDIALQLSRPDVFREEPPIRVPAIKTTVGSKNLYTFLLSAERLLEFAYIFRVETNNLLSSSYQRLLQRKKMGKLRTYLSNRAGFFPNNLIVATSEMLQFVTEDSSQRIQNGWLTLPDKPCYMEILDGQHRLYAYASLNGLQNHPLCVTVIQAENGTPLNDVERAALFVTINKEQTPVPSHILWDLYRLIDPTSVRARIADFVYTLNRRRPFQDLIRLPRVRSSRAYLSFSNMCSSLYKRRLFANYGLQPTFQGVFDSYFEKLLSNRYLREDWERSVNNRQRKGFLCTNNGISILLKLFSMILETRGLPTEREIGEWSRNLNRWIIIPLRNYLETKRRRDIPNDPFMDLRRANTSEGERTKTANEIFALSPLANE